MDLVLDKLGNVLHDNDTVILGCSGGMDSMCLLYLLEKVHQSIKIVCVNIDHNVRINSANDSMFVKQYCEKHHITFEFFKIDNGFELNEAELRKVRYSFFKSVYQKYHADYLLTAHHGDDLIETVLMRLARGSNLGGYIGIEIQSYSHGMKILRPLLYVTKDDIKKYIKTQGISYVEDETNSTDNYTRNRYRHNVLPLLKSENASLHLKYLDFGYRLREYEDFVYKIAKKKRNLIYKSNKYDVEAFNNLELVIQKKILEIEFKEIYVDNLDLINSKHVRGVLDLFKSQKANAVFCLPDNILACKSYNEILFKRNEKQYSAYNQILESELIVNGSILRVVDISDDTSNNTIRLNSSEIILPLIVRNRKPGDKIFTKNLNGSQKIKDIFIDNKINKDLRDSIPILVDSNDNVLWIPGVKKSKFDKKKHEKYDIIVEYRKIKEK